MLIALKRFFSRWENWLSIAFVSVVAGFYARHMWSSLFRTWFFSSDEYVVVAEAIRFLHLDFRKYYFDQLGTPLMTITAIVWSGVYGAWHLLGRAPQGLEWFTYHHLPQLFIFMRGITYGFAILSLALLFVLTA